MIIEIRLTINELSKIVGISGRNIRYYNDIGLFKSSGTLENGYRYFTLDKIEEINSINYLRHMGIPIREIQEHMQKRDLETYGSILGNHLEKVTEEIENLEKIRRHIQRRISTLNYVKQLPPIGEIIVKSMPKQKVIKTDATIKQQMDWELSLNQIIEENHLTYGVFVGDLGFVVDMRKVKTRGAEEFTGMYLITDEQMDAAAANVTEYDEGDWLMVYVRGSHREAKRYYEQLISYAREHQLMLGDHALERMLIDHYISNDEEDHITEIMVPVIDSDIQFL